MLREKEIVTEKEILREKDYSSNVNIRTKTKGMRESSCLIRKLGIEIHRAREDRIQGKKQSKVKYNNNYKTKSKRNKLFDVEIRK